MTSNLNYISLIIRETKTLLVSTSSPADLHISCEVFEPLKTHRRNFIGTLHEVLADFFDEMLKRVCKRLHLNGVPLKLLHLY
jgi:hypothetical protein